MYTSFYFTYIYQWYVNILLLHVHLIMLFTHTFTSCTFKVGKSTYFYFMYIQGWVYTYFYFMYIQGMYVHLLLLHVYSRLVCTHTFTLCTFKVGMYTYFTSCTFKVGMYTYFTSCTFKVGLYTYFTSCTFKVVIYTYFYFLYIQGWYVYILLLIVHSRLVFTHTFALSTFKVGMYRYFYLMHIYGC